MNWKPFVATVLLSWGSHSHASVTAMAYVGCDPDSVSSSASPDMPVSASSQGMTGAAFSAADPRGAIEGRSNANFSGIGCGWTGAGSYFNILRATGLRAGQALPAHALVTGTIALDAFSQPGSFGIGQAIANTFVKTSFTQQSSYERLQVENGIVTPLSEVHNGVNLTITPFITIEAELGPFQLDANDLISLGFTGSLTGTFDDAAQVYNFSVGQAAILTAFFALTGLPSRGISAGPATIGFDYSLSADRQFIVDLDLTNSDYLDMFAFVESKATKEATGVANVTLGNSVSSGLGSNPGVGMKNIRFYVADDYADDISNVRVNMGSGYSVAIERYSDVFGSDVPEVSVWLMFTLGFGAVGISLRGSRRAYLSWA